MKKVLTLVFSFLFILLFVGCDMSNTPTKKVEEYLNNYKSLDDKVISQIDELINEDTNMTDEQKENYKEILKRQYKDLTYTIKDEVIDGDVATVTAEIEVYDFYKTNLDSSKYYEENTDQFMTDDNIDDSLFVDYRIKSLEKSTDRITYTIDFTLTKVDNKWVINDLDSTSIQKIHGLYAH